ncbi:MAG: Peptidase flavivirus helicase [Bryobacterales bacterium]|nr:Peptidase flavivirus helicase [Bryobacterales bacterium]
MLPARTLLLISIFTAFLNDVRAQTITVNANISLTAGRTDEIISGTGPGTVTPGGATTTSLDGSSSGDDNCSNLVQADFVATLANGDKLNLRMNVPGIDNAPPTFTLTGTFVVIGGTGQFAGKGGTGSVTLFVTRATNQVTISATGTLTNQLVALPSIKPSGVVPVYARKPVIQPGSWVSIYGNNLASAVTEWKGDFPVALGNVTATVNGKSAYLWFVSPGQINLQVPDDSKRGCVEVRVNTPSGSDSIQVELAGQAPSLSLLDGRYPAAIILTPNGTGAYGSSANSYDIAGAPGRYTYNTRKVRKGENIVLYGVGFGPTTPAVPSGKTFSGAATVGGVPYSFDFGGVTFVPPFVGLVGAGLYQINLRVPANIPSGDIQIRFNVNGTGTQDGIFITVE